jgi:hypothetical protein
MGFIISSSNTLAQFSSWFRTLLVHFNSENVAATRRQRVFAAAAGKPPPLVQIAHLEYFIKTCWSEDKAWGLLRQAPLEDQEQKRNFARFCC